MLLNVTAVPPTAGQQQQTASHLFLKTFAHRCRLSLNHSPLSQQHMMLLEVTQTIPKTSRLQIMS